MKERIQTLGNYISPEGRSTYTYSEVIHLLSILDDEDSLFHLLFDVVKADRYNYTYEDSASLAEIFQFRYDRIDRNKSQGDRGI